MTPGFLKPNKFVKKTPVWEVFLYHLNKVGDDTFFFLFQSEKFALVFRLEFS